MKVLTIKNKKEEKFLRTPTKAFNFNKFSKKEIRELIKEMRKTMKEKEGVGLSANQVGLNFKMFIAEIPDKNGKKKFYVIFNPELEKESEEKEIGIEGCLSVPDMIGEVKRTKKITVAGYDKNGKKIKVKAFGFLARVFQHEIDHLNGILFIDKAKKLFETKEKDLT